MKLQHARRKVLCALLAVALTLSLAPAALGASEYDASGATSFVFSNSGITVSAGSYAGYAVEGTDLTINAAGTYIVSGTCTDGSITVKKGTTGVTLVLSGLTLTSADTAPIACNKSSAVTIVVAAGTTNTLTDTAKNNDETYPDNTLAENAVIKCKDGSQVTISGTGTLNVVANGKNGIKSGATTDTEGEAWLVIQDVKLSVTAKVNDAINAEATLTILSGTLTISAADDAIHSDYILTIGVKGSAAGPNITITACTEGLEGATLTVYSGNIVVHSTDDGLNAANSDLTGYNFSLTIAGGSLYVDAASGDGLDSNGTLTISGGTVEIYSSAAGDNSPLDSDGAFTLSGGTVLAVGNSGMAQNPTGTAQTYVSFGSGRQIGGMGQRAQGSSVSITAGSTIAVMDSSGATLYSGKALRAANYVFFSSDALTTGSTYTLYVGGAAAATGTAQSSGGGAQPGGMGPGGAPPEGGQPGGMGPGGTRPGTGGFTDVTENQWYYEAVRYVHENGLFSGTSEHTFGPDVQMTRAMLAVVLYRYEGGPAGTWENSFADVEDGAWYTDAILWANANGIVTGYAGGLFGTNDSITREQMAAILYRYAGYKKYDTNKSQELTAFTDADGIAPYALTGMKWANAEGLISGRTATTLAPAGTATRAEVAAILMRFAQNIV